MSPLAISLVLAASCWFGPCPDEPEQAFDFVLEDVNPRSETHGRRLALGDLVAERGLVLQFMASWCAPCREELPVLQALYADEGAPLVFIAADEGGGPESILIVAERAGLTAPILFVPPERTEEIAEHYRYQIVPSTYVIGRDRTILGLHEGAMSRKRLVRWYRKKI